MWTFKTECNGVGVTSSKKFSNRKDAWDAAMEWADISYMNGEVVPVTIVAVPSVIQHGKSIDAVAVVGNA